MRRLKKQKCSKFESNHGRLIQLTKSECRVASRKISHIKLAAPTVSAFWLPNPAIQNSEECSQWPQGTEVFTYNGLIDDEIKALLQIPPPHGDANSASTTTSSLAADMERKRVEAHRTRPNQARFRRAVLGSDPHCIITNVRLPEVLEAAHIVPYKYRGEDTAANGLCLRMDIHQLFDCGELRLKPNGEVVLTDRARLSYGYTIPPEIRIPDVVNRDYVRWRWENYNGY